MVLLDGQMALTRYFEGVHFIFCLFRLLSSSYFVYFFQNRFRIDKKSRVLIYLFLIILWIIIWVLTKDNIGLSEG